MKKILILLFLLTLTPDTGVHAQEYRCEVAGWNDPEYGDLVQDLASKGSTEHQYILGLRCEKSTVARAKYWYSNAAEPDVLKFGSSYPDGHALAQYRLALIEIEEKNYESAIPLLKRASMQSMAAAQNLLGELFQKGRGVEKDYGEAYKLYLSSAMLGCSDAQANLSWLLQLGEGTEQNFIEALAWAKVSMISTPVPRSPPRNFKVVIPRITVLEDNLSTDELSESSNIARKYYRTYVEALANNICPTF